MHRDVDDNGNEWVGWERYVEVWGVMAPPPRISLSFIHVSPDFVAAIRRHRF